MTPLNVAYWVAAVTVVYRGLVYIHHVFTEGHRR
jgi:hypothetical protein